MTRHHTTRNYTAAELMVVAASREIRDNEIVFVGMRLPLLAFLLAKSAHAPNAVALYENGLIRETPAPELLFTMGDPPNVLNATMAADMMTVMSFLQNRRVDIGFLGAGEVDKFGNLNSTLVKKSDGSHIRLPGSGGAADIASLAKRTVALMEHSKKRLPARVSYMTSPGHGTGPGWRESVGLPPGGASCLITTKALMRFDETSKEAQLVSAHPGVTFDELQRETGWELTAPEPFVETAAPTEKELKLIRMIDPEGFWTS